MKVISTQNLSYEISPSTITTPFLYFAFGARYGTSIFKFCSIKYEKENYQNLIWNKISYLKSINSNKI